MALSELECKEALRAATDWLVMSDVPGAEAAREGIANVIPLVVMGQVVPADLDELASIVEEYGQSMRRTDQPAETFTTQLKEAVQAAFEHVKAG